MSDYSFWADTEIHSKPDQLGRQKSAMDKKLAPIEIDETNKSCRIKGSGKEAYEVHLEKCSCIDYVRRIMPCKHMYRLAHELGVFALPVGTKSSTAAPIIQDQASSCVDIKVVKENFKKLPPKDHLAVLDFLKKQNLTDSSPFRLSILDKQMAGILTETGLLVAAEAPWTEKIDYLSRGDMLRLLDEIDPKASKAEYDKRTNSKQLAKLLYAKYNTEMSAMEARIYFLESSPAVLGKYATLPSHLARQYVNFPLCEECFTETKGVVMDELAYFTSHLFGFKCENCRKERPRVNVHKAQIEDMKG